MDLMFVDQNKCLTEDTRELAERRLLFALSRFGSRIDRVTAIVGELPGPRGVIQHSCQVTVKLRRLGEVTVSGEDAELAVCLARAAERAGRAVWRLIARTQPAAPRRLFPV